MIDDDDGTIAAILKSTGRRPAVDVDRTDRVRAAVHAAWAGTIDRRARRRRIAWTVLSAAAVVIGAIGLGLVWRRTPPSPPLEASGVRVERVLADAMALRPGSIVPWRTTLVTGPNERVALRLPSGHSVRVDAGSALTIVSDRTLDLARGRIYVDVAASTAPARGSIEIRAPAGRVEDSGTQFSVAADERGALTVRVREGSVTVTSATGSVKVDASEIVRVSREGRIEPAADPTPEEGWGWAETVAPMMRIDGRPLSEFLAWAARERGVRLQFPDASFSKRADGIILRGSIDGMTLEEAVASVTATSGLDHRWERGVLIVEAP